MTKILEEIEEIFGKQNNESFLDTARVLGGPSQISREMAAQSVQSINLTQILKDLGVSAAQQIANDLEALGLRPADYADLPDLPQTVTRLLIQALQKMPTEFVLALLEQLKLRG